MKRRKDCARMQVRKFHLVLGISCFLAQLAIAPFAYSQFDDLDSSVEETLDEEFQDLDNFEQDELSEIENLENSLDQELSGDSVAEDALTDDALSDESFSEELGDELNDLEGLEAELEEPIQSEELGESLEAELEEIPAEDTFVEEPIEETPVVDQPVEQPLEEIPEPEMIDQPFEEEVPSAEQIVQEVPEPTPLDNTPNSAREEVLNRMFENYSQRISDSDWGIIAGEYYRDAYQIQNGDTLWDISTTLFGTGFFWPKLWQLNPEITNPHMIEPGNVLNFHPGGPGEGPKIEVVQLPAKEVQEMSGEASADEEMTEVRIVRQPFIPPPKRRKPVLRKLPPSLPYIGRSESGYDEDGFALDDRKRTLRQAFVMISDVIIEDDIEEVGEIVEMESWSKTATEGQYIYIESENVSVGQKFIAVKEGDLVEHPENGDNIGDMLNIQAIVEVVYPVNQEDNIYKAKVVRAIEPVLIDSKLIRGTIKNVSISKNGPQKEVQAQIVGGRFDNLRRYLTLHSIVFLNRGANQGLQPGDILNIIRNMAVRKESSYAMSDQAPIGKLKIADVRANVSTAIVVEAQDEIIPGDFTGNAPQLSMEQYRERLKTKRADVVDITDGEEEAPPKEDESM